ncbi:MAG: hypothetical protein ACR2KZ_11980 [Segetibacter sp.]
MYIMFSSISWTEYLVVIAFLVIVYYLFVGVKFYSFELLALVKWKRALLISKSNESSKDMVNESTNHLQNSQFDLFPSYQSDVPQVEKVDETFEKVEEFTTRLKEVIEEAASTNSTKKEFILSLQTLLKNYHFLTVSPFLVAINNLIASECERHGFIHLSADERVMLWDE